MKHRSEYNLVHIVAATEILGLKYDIAMWTLLFGATISIRDVKISPHTHTHTHARARTHTHTRTRTHTHTNIELLLSQSEWTLRVRSHLTTTTRTFHIVSITYYIIRNVLLGYQCYCLHMTIEKKPKIMQWTHRCRQVRTDPKCSKFCNEPSHSFLSNTFNSYGNFPQVDAVYFTNTNLVYTCFPPLALKWLHYDIYCGFESMNFYGVVQPSLARSLHVERSFRCATISVYL